MKRYGAFLAVTLYFVMAAQEIGSESVTLSTYYPAPSGIYTQMITTSYTSLARDAGKAAIGNSSPYTSWGSLLTVNGNASIGSGYAATAAPTNGLIVQGRMGVGTFAPGSGYAIDVNGKAQVSGYTHIGAPSCTLYANVANMSCSSAQYATWTQGLYQEGYAYQSIPTVYVTAGIQALMDNRISFFCCTR